MMMMICTTWLSPTYFKEFVLVNCFLTENCNTKIYSPLQISFMAEPRVWVRNTAQGSAQDSLQSNGSWSVRWECEPFIIQIQDGIVVVISGAVGLANYSIIWVDIWKIPHKFVKEMRLCCDCKLRHAYHCSCMLVEQLRIKVQGCRTKNRPWFWPLCSHSFLFPSFISF